MAETGSFAGPRTVALRTSDTSASCLVAFLRRPYPNAAETLMRREGRFDVAATEPFHHAVDEVQVHAADQLGVLGGELVEGAVRQTDLLVVDPGLVAERLQHIRRLLQLCRDPGARAHPSPGPRLPRLGEVATARPRGAADRLRQRRQ